MTAPSRAVPLICHAGAAAPPYAALCHQLAEFQAAEAIPATPIQALAMHFLPPRETYDVDGWKNVCNQARCPQRNSLRRSQAFRSARCEMAGDLPSLLLFHAIARVREALLRDAREASQCRERAKVHPGCGRARQLPAQSRAHRIAAANPGAAAGLARFPISRRVVRDNVHR